MFLSQPVPNEHDGIPNKQVTITTAHSLIFVTAVWDSVTLIITDSDSGGLSLMEYFCFFLFLQPGALGSFSMSAPITKVVKNDAYTAPRPPVPVAPTRQNTSSAAAARSSAAALQPVSRTLQQSTAGASTTAPAPPQVNTLAFICY